MKKLACLGMMALALVMAPVAIADVSYDCSQDCPDPGMEKCGGQINVSGATLFLAFFEAPAATNDYLDVNCNGLPDPNDPISFEQLAPEFNGANWSGWWLFQYRGVGSGNGLAEFVTSQCDGLVPIEPPSDKGIINRFAYSVGGNIQNPYGCQPDPESDCCDAGTPVCPDYIDLAVMDVPTGWFVTNGDQGNAAWTKNPGEDGYGLNPMTSWNDDQGNLLKNLGCLNTNYGDPNDLTVYDTTIAWVPIAIIANRGTGLENVTKTELQYHWLTGRFPSGENFVAATRDSGSGTRNGAMSTLDIDPSWGRGDNLDAKSKVSDNDPLGPIHTVTNKGGSSRMEAGVQNRRLAIGYTGLIGGSRAAADAFAGKYELLNVDFDGDGTYTRPSLDGVLDNGNESDNAWQIGGPETFASLGDPNSDTTGNPAMANQTAADFLRNLTASIADFEEVPGGEETFFSPGEWLAENFILTAAVDALPSADPGVFVANDMLNPTLQTWTRNFNQLTVPGYGITAANKVPVRASNPDWPDGSPFTDGEYTDGSTNGNYYNRHTDDLNNPVGGSIQGGDNLNARNAIAGDFDGDGVRSNGDIDDMLDAYADPTAYTLANSTAGDPVVVEIIGDFDGDGNFTMEDIRYFADGLVINPATGNLDRQLGFCTIDAAFDGNFFGTEVYDEDGNPVPYVQGASSADVAGDVAWPGAAPNGADGVVDATDIAYIQANFGNWNDINVAITIDLSCDLNGDLMVNEADVWVARYYMGMPLAGDMDCDGDVDFDDIGPFVNAIGGASEPCCNYLNGDMDEDGDVDFDDIAPFVAAIGG